MKLKEIQAYVATETPHYTERSDDEKQAWLNTLAAHKADANTRKHVNKKAEEVDAGYTSRDIANEVRVACHACLPVC